MKELYRQKFSMTEAEKKALEGDPEKMKQMQEKMKEANERGEMDAEEKYDDRVEQRAEEEKADMEKRLSEAANRAKAFEDLLENADGRLKDNEKEDLVNEVQKVVNSIADVYSDEAEDINRRLHQIREKIIGNFTEIN